MQLKKILSQLNEEYDNFFDDELLTEDEADITLVIDEWLSTLDNKSTDKFFTKKIYAKGVIDDAVREITVSMINDDLVLNFNLNLFDSMAKVLNKIKQKLKFKIKNYLKQRNVDNAMIVLTATNKKKFNKI